MMATTQVTMDREQHLLPSVAVRNFCILQVEAPMASNQENTALLKEKIKNTSIY